jgi:hypothetical protein
MGAPLASRAFPFLVSTTRPAEPKYSLLMYASIASKKGFVSVPLRTTWRIVPARLGEAFVTARGCLIAPPTVLL